MAQLQQFLFELLFGQTRRIREYMLKRYNVYCGSVKDLEQAINGYIPNEGILEELSEVLAWQESPARGNGQENSRL